LRRNIARKNLGTCTQSTGFAVGSRHSIKRIRRQIAGATLVAGLWGHASDENREQLQTTAAADYYVSSLREALSLCIDAVSGHLPKLPATRNAEAATTAA
jgi:hypothetical protein